jgi:hypothetical protein
VAKDVLAVPVAELTPDELQADQPEATVKADA